MTNPSLTRTHGPEWDVPLGSTAQFRCRCYLPERISRVKLPAHSITDEIRHLLYPGAGDTNGSTTSGVTAGGTAGAAAGGGIEAQSWREQKEFDHIDADIQYVRLDGGRVLRGSAAISATGPSGIAGFYAKPRLKRCNFRMQPESALYPARNRVLDTIYWRAVQGNSWVTRSPYNEPSPASRLFHAAQLPNATAKVRTEKPLKAGQQWFLRLSELQIAEAQNGSAGVRFEWGKRYSVCFRQDLAPTFDVLGRDSKWHTLKTFSEFGTVTNFSGNIDLFCEIINGCLALTLNQHSFYVPEAAPDGRTLQNMTWPAAPLMVSLFGVSATIGGGLLVTQDRDGKPLRPSFSRTVPLPIPPGVESEKRAVKLRAKGWRVGKARAGAAHVKIEVDEDTSHQVKYTARLVCDGMVSPFLVAVGGTLPMLPGEEEGAYLDIARALDGTATSKGINPPDTLSREIVLTVNRKRLEELAQVVALPEGKKWDDYVQEYSPADFAVRWVRPDKTTTPWHGFRGYQFINQMDTQGPNKQYLQLVIRDPMWRSSGENAKVDEKFAPLDFLIDGEKSLYGADFVQHIHHVQNGPVEAGRMNGNGNAREFLGPGHPPFITNSTALGFYPLVKPLTQGGFTFRPPYKLSVSDWWKELATTDFCVCFFGHVQIEGGHAVTANSTGDPEEWPVLIYGDYRQIVARRPIYDVTDAVEEIGLHDWYLTAQSVTYNPEKRINRVRVFSNPPGADAGNLPYPAIFMASAELEPSDPNSAAHSWYRDLIVARDDLFFEGAAQWLAEGILFDKREVDPRYPTLSMRGRPLQFGDRLMVHNRRTQDNHPKGDGSDEEMRLDRTQSGEREMWIAQTPTDTYDFRRGDWRVQTTAAPVWLAQRLAIQQQEGGEL